MTRLSEKSAGKDAGLKCPEATPQRVVEDISARGRRRGDFAANRSRKTFSDRVKLLEAGTELGDMWETAGCMPPLDLIE